MATTTYNTSTNTAAGGAQTTVYTPSTAPAGTGQPVPNGTDVASLNAARDAAANSGQNVYAGNLSSLASFSAAPVAPSATPAGPISAQGVTNPPQPLSVPSTGVATADTAGTAVQGTAAAANAALIKQQQDLAAQDQTQVTSNTSLVQGLIDKLSGKGAAETQMETDAGIPDKTQQLTDITNEYNTKQLAAQHQLDAIYQNGSYSPAQAAAEASAVSRQNNAELADLAVRQSVAQGNLTAAQGLIDNKIALQYGDLKDIIGYQMNFLQANQANLSKDQQNQLNLQITQNQQQYDTETAAAKSLETQKLTTLQNAMEMGAPASVQNAIQQATTPEAAIAAAGNYGGGLDAEAKRASIAASQSSTAKNNFELAQEEGSATTSGGGAIPAIVQPYAATTASGIGYVDASTLQGTAAEKTKIINAAQAAGLKVITNKNEAADLTNIQNAYSNLDTIQQTFAGITSPSVASRLANNAGLNQLATGLQTDPQKVAAGALNDSALDILKAISGIQGFRGNASAIAQIKENMPAIYDTTATADAKIATVKQLIQNRENAIVGTPDASTNLPTPSKDKSGNITGGTTASGLTYTVTY